MRTSHQSLLSGTATTRSVPENTPAGEDIGEPVAATDADAGDMLTYTLGGDDAGFVRHRPGHRPNHDHGSARLRDGGQLQGHGHGHVTRHGEDRHHRGDDHGERLG